MHYNIMCNQSEKEQPQGLLMHIVLKFPLGFCSKRPRTTQFVKAGYYKALV